MHIKVVFGYGLQQLLPDILFGIRMANFYVSGTLLPYRNSKTDVLSNRRMQAGYFNRVQ